MDRIAADRPHEEEIPKVPDIHIEVENLGPIRKGKIRLRPLTVFVGPSNTGKTYLAILIYALHRIFRGFPRFPVVSDYLYSKGDELTISDGEYRKFLKKLGDDERPFYFSDMPEAVRNATRSALHDPDFLATNLGDEMERCFDVESIGSLIGMSSKPKCINLSLQIGGDRQKNWAFRTMFSDSDIRSDGNIDDMILLREKISSLDPTYAMRVGPLRHALMRGGARRGRRRSIIEFVEFFEMLSYSMLEAQSSMHYFPADRSGIMHSHRVIASSLVTRSTRGGLERFPELPILPGVMADFIEQLILHDGPAPRHRHRRRRTPEEYMGHIADLLERETLDGQIRTVRGKAGGYPEFVYCPKGTEGEIRLSRASSMVSELASLVLFMRTTIGRGDTVIIEEPEAHLHPAAQTAMAKALARLVRAGVRVVVTTHSDWLLKEIGNLIREGELSGQLGESEDESAGALRPSDVGVWLFDRLVSAGGSTVREIPFDRIDGIEPADYASVAERLYNRSADLQNRFEEEVAHRRAPG